MPPAVQPAMGTIEFVKPLAVFAHTQVAGVALRTAGSVEPVLVTLENHEVEQAQQDADESDSLFIAEEDRKETADQYDDQYDEADALDDFVGKVAYPPHRTCDEDACNGRHKADCKKQDVGFHRCMYACPAASGKLSSNSVRGNKKRGTKL